MVLLSIFPGARSARAQEVAPADTSPIDTATDAAAARKIVLAYKGGEVWPLRNFEGLDVLEPFVPVAAAGRHDFGRIVLNTGVPYALFASAFAFKSKDKQTLIEIQRWKWVGLDEKSDNYPLLYGLVGLAGLSLMLPSPEDGDGYSWDLRFDRATVFALGMCAASLEDVLLKPVFDRTRPNGRLHTSRPSGHVLSAAAASSFFADVLRDTFHPQDEPNLEIRILKEAACAVPYLGAGYIALERVHGNKHFLTDTLLAAAIGSLTMHLFYSWSFTRIEQGRAWFDTAYVGYDPDQKGILFAVVGSF